MVSKIIRKSFVSIKTNFYYTLSNALQQCCLLAIFLLILNVVALDSLASTSSGAATSHPAYA